MSDGELKNAQITMTYGKVREMEERIKDLSKLLTQANDEVRKLSLKTDVGLGEQYREAFMDAFVIIQFALGNLDVMTFRGWPVDAMYRFAASLGALPYLTDSMKEISNDLRLLANEAKKWEDARAKGIEQDLLVEENARRQGVTTAPAV